MAIKSQSQITLHDVSDAVNVILTSEAYTFIGNTVGAPAGLSCSTQAVALQGSNQCPVVNVNKNDIICPEGISAEVSNSGSSTPTITFRTTKVVSEACEAVIPVVVGDITINKKISFAVAKTGAQGAQGNKGDKGDKGDQGEQGDKGDKGDTGEAGADAILVSVSASNGTVFKNNSGSTVLTAHVYKGGVEQEITDAGVCGTLGSIKWYQGDTYKATAKSYTVNAADVDNVAGFTCNLEG